jgi:hypothetical protein
MYKRGWTVCNLLALIAAYLPAPTVQPARHQINYIHVLNVGGQFSPVTRKKKMRIPTTIITSAGTRKAHPLNILLS